MNTTTHHSSIIAVAELLGRISTDYQLDPAHPDYCGFINVGDDLLRDEDVATWMEAVNPANRDWVMPIVKALGMEVEGGGVLEYYETVFVKK